MLVLLDRSQSERFTENGLPYCNKLNCKDGGDGKSYENPHVRWAVTIDDPHVHGGDNMPLNGVYHASGSFTIFYRKRPGERFTENISLSLTVYRIVRMVEGTNLIKTRMSGGQ